MEGETTLAIAQAEIAFARLPRRVASGARGVSRGDEAPARHRCCTPRADEAARRTPRRGNPRGALVAGASAAKDDREVRHDTPPAVNESTKPATQNPTQAKDQPYEPASGLDHGSVGGSVDRTAPGPTGGKGEPAPPPGGGR